MKFTRISNLRHRKDGGTSVSKDTFIIVSFRWSSQKKVSKKNYLSFQYFIGQIRKKEKKDTYYDGRKDDGKEDQTEMRKWQTCILQEK